MANKLADSTLQYWAQPAMLPMPAPLTLRRFVDEHFQKRVALRKRSTQLYYRTQARLVLDGVPAAPLLRSGGAAGPDAAPRDGGLGAILLARLTPADVQELISTMQCRGYSSSSVRAVRRFIQTLYHYAQQAGFDVRPPGKRVEVPAFEPSRTLHALTLEQLSEVLQGIVRLRRAHGQDPEPYRAMVLMGALTGMNVAELCGLRWARVNLTGRWANCDGESLPPFSLAVREQHTIAGYHTVKTRKRRRIIPMARAVMAALLDLPPGEPSAPVFCSGAGTPVVAHNALERVLKPVGRACGMPWLCWHDLRRTFATLTDEAGLSPSQRQALMGHATASMTAHYTLASPEGARAALDNLAARLDFRKPLPRLQVAETRAPLLLEASNAENVSELYSPSNE